MKPSFALSEGCLSQCPFVLSDVTFIYGYQIEKLLSIFARQFTKQVRLHKEHSTQNNANTHKPREVFGLIRVSQLTIYLRLEYRFAFE